MLTKVFHFDSPREKYECDAVIVWCFDNRFNLAFSKFLKRRGIENADPIKVAGGAKCLATPDQDAERSFVLEQIRKSIRLHHTKRAILMVHSDCGAYGGLAAFENDEQGETEHHENELRKAVEFLRSQEPQLEIWAFHVNFDGIWEA